MSRYLRVAPICRNPLVFLDRLGCGKFAARVEFWLRGEGLGTGRKDGSHCVIRVCRFAGVSIAMAHCCDASSASSEGANATQRLGKAQLVHLNPPGRCCSVKAPEVWFVACHWEAS